MSDLGFTPSLRGNGMEARRDSSGAGADQRRQTNKDVDEGTRGLEFRTMMRRYRGWVHRCLRRAGVPQRDRDDVAQEVWWFVAEKLATFEPVGARSVSTWLGCICYFKVKDYRKEVAGRRESPAPLDDDGRPSAGAAGTQDPEETFAAAQDSAILCRLIARLEPPYRDVVEMHFFRQVPMIKAAAALGIIEGTAWTRRRIALRHLRREWRKLEPWRVPELRITPEEEKDE